MEYISEIISFVVGAITGGIAMRWHIDKSTRYTGTQTGNTAGGDIAGRDIRRD